MRRKARGKGKLNDAERKREDLKAIVKELMKVLSPKQVGFTHREDDNGWFNRPKRKKIPFSICTGRFQEVETPFESVRCYTEKGEQSPEDYMIIIQGEDFKYRFPQSMALYVLRELKKELK